MISKRSQVRILTAIAILICISILWSVYKTTFPVESPEDGLIGTFMALLYCLPVILLNGFVRHYYQKNFPEEFSDSD